MGTEGREGSRAMAVTLDNEYVVSSIATQTSTGAVASGWLAAGADSEEEEGNLEDSAPDASRVVVDDDDDEDDIVFVMRPPSEPRPPSERGARSSMQYEDGATSRASS